MSAQERRILTTSRDCPARLVPVGDPITIPAHTFVTLTQSLGGNYTLVYNGNMVRVDTHWILLGYFSDIMRGVVAY